MRYLTGLFTGFGLGVLYAMGVVSCSTAHSATYGNDVAATSVVSATVTAAADTTRGGK